MSPAKTLSTIFYVIAAFFILLGIDKVASSPSHGTDAAVILTFGFGALFIILGTLAAVWEPNENLKLIAWGELISPRYYIGEEGIYKGKKLLLRWSEIANIVAHEYEYGNTIFKMETWRILTTDGREIVINYVINPKETLEYIKNTYLRNKV